MALSLTDSPANEIRDERTIGTFDDDDDAKENDTNDAMPRGRGTGERRRDGQTPFVL